MPKLLLAASVPAIDWNTRSTGEPLRISSSVVVTCASTQLWVGMSSLRGSRRASRAARCARSGLSVAGLMPITASPAAEQQAVENAGRDAARRRRSDGWAAAAPTAGRAGRSCCGSASPPAFRRDHHQVLQAADLADRRRHLRRDAGRERRELRRRRLVRQQPVAEAADGQMRDRREGRAGRGCRRSAASPRRLRRGRPCSLQERRSGRSASANCAATRSSPVSAARPASWSPLRNGVAFASSVLRSRTCSGELRWSRCTCVEAPRIRRPIIADRALRASASACHSAAPEKERALKS